MTSSTPNCMSPPEKPLAGKFDALRFQKAVHDLKRDTKPSEQEEEAHLAKLEMWTTSLGLVGLLLAIQGRVSILAMLCVGFYKYAKFAILAHHSLHGGWGRRRRGWFARGVYRRTVDWLDWIMPEAWIEEHNKVHHYYLNEDVDPDFVQRNLGTLHSCPSMIWRYLVLFSSMATWKWSYYASNTLKIVHANKEGAPKEKELEGMITLSSLFFGLPGLPRIVLTNATWRWYFGFVFDLFGPVMGHTFLFHFVLIPLIAQLVQNFLYGGTSLFCGWTFVNLLGSELVSNVHSFMTIVTNHSGADLWSFTESCKADTAEFFLRCVLASTAYPAGTDIIDYFHGFLNYQAEHHAFPELSPLHYQRLHPPFKNLCQQFGVPYVQENVFRRTKKTMDVIVGKTEHKILRGQCTENPELWMVERGPVLDN